MVRVGVIGAGGRMGREICRAVLEADDLELVAAADPSTGGVPLESLLGGTAEQSLTAITVAPSPDQFAASGCDVAIDFSVAAASRENLPKLAAAGIHAVVGTTGLSDEDLAELRRRFDGTSANAVVAANFALGAVLLMHSAAIVAPFMEGVEVIELHHDAKRDAPSGTAMHTVEGIAAARAAAGAGPLPPDPTSETLLEGARGGVGADGIHIHSVRLPGLITHEEIIFGAMGQSLTLRHDAFDRRSFMPGVLLAARAVSTRPGLTVGLEAILGF